jgi:glyoxylase-like metal-dependent hydrolase (beta-lactamase superfamily II)
LRTEKLVFANKRTELRESVNFADRKKPNYAMHIQKFIFNDFQENTLVISDSLKNCVIVDPGCYYPYEKTELLNYLEQNSLKPLALLNTHCHIDHILGNKFISDTFQVPFYMHREDLQTLNAVPNYAPMYGFVGFEPSPQPSHLVEEGEVLHFGELSFEVIFGPGHAPGHVAYYAKEEGILINGDILFRGSFGRYDLPNGDFNTLKKTITEKLFKLPADTLVYCGHGPETTIGIEQKTNPILSY